MSLVEMPDGELVDLPDNPSPELKAKIKAKVDQIRAAKTAPPVNEVSAAVEQQKKERADQAFDPGGSAHGSVGETEIAQGVQERQSAWTPLIARTAGPLVGGAIGSVVPGVGTAVGAAIGAGAGDWIAQNNEIDTGLRTAYNPLRTGGEIITAGYFSKFQAGKTLMQAAAKGALGNMASDTFINLTEGKGLPSTFDLAVSGLTGGILAGTGQKGEAMWNARRAAALEMSGSNQVAEGIADFMGPRRTGEQLDLSLKAPAKQLELSPKAAGFSRMDTEGIPMRREAGAAETAVREQAGWPQPEAPQPELVGPSLGITKPGKPKITAAQVKQRKKWTDQQLTEQFGFDDLEDGRTFEKIMNTPDLPDNYSLNLKEASTADKSAKVYQITGDEQAEWARMKALARGKKEMLDTPLDRDPTFGDTSPTTYFKPERGLANKPEEELTRGERGRLARSRATQGSGRIKDIFKRLEVDHDYPVYQDYHDSSQAYRKAQLDVSRDSEAASEALNKTSKADRIAIFQAFLGGGDFSNLPRKLQSKASRLWDIADNQLSEYDLTAKDYFGDYLPQVTSGKSMKQIIEEGTASSMIPNRLRFAEDAADALLSPQDPSIVRVMNKVIEVGAYKRHVADVAAPLKLKYGADSTAPEAIKTEMQRYLSSLKGSTGDPSAERVDQIFSMITGTLGMKMSGRELANGFVRATHEALMAARPAAVIKNAMQNIQTGIPLYGIKSFTVGLKRAMTEEGMDVARRAGVLGGGNQLQEFGVRAGVVHRLAEKGLSPFQYIEEKNRAIAYLAGLDKFDRALGQATKRSGRASWKVLMDKADIDKLSEPEIGVLAKMWDAGESMDKIRHTYSSGIVDDTQFMYMMPEKAKILQSQAGRVGLGYANYGQGYASYMARMFGQGPVKKRIRQGLMWAGTNAALAGTFAKVGGIFGDDDGFSDALGWTFTGPLMYGGGPIVTTAQSLGETVRKTTQGQMSAKSALKQTAKDVSTFVPFGGTAQDIIKAYNEPTAKEAIGRYLGFRRGKK